MNIIKNAAGKWLVEATDSEVLFLNAKVQTKQCPDKCPFSIGCEDVRRCSNIRIEFREVAKKISNAW